jgi:two-component system cell cycle response regulator
MAAKAKILLIEDSPTQSRHIKQILEKSGYQVVIAENGVTGLRMITAENPDVIILDVVLPDISGHEVCRWIKVRDETKGIPVIMLTVKGKLSEKVSGLHIGADDYLPKPFKESELNARIYASLRTREFQEELKKKNEQLEKLLKKVEIMAITDAGTGLFNRRRFEGVLRRDFVRSVRYNEPLTLIMIDVDHFKSINDNFGHQVGDQVLADVAKIIQKQFREADMVARYGGEEFVVVMPKCPVQDAAIPAGRLLKEISGHSFDGIKGKKRKITVSIGIAGLPDPDLDTEEKLIRCADTALYDAKESGRNRIATCRGKDMSPPFLEP